MPDRAALLDVKGLTTVFDTDDGEVRAVDGVDFSLERGRTLGIVGESGCGKSVTALSIMGLVPQPPGRIVAGEVRFEGEDLLKLPPARLRELRGARLSMIFQEPMTSLNPAFSVGDQEPRIAGERHRDHHALAHAAREPVRVVARAALRRRNAHAAQHLDRLVLRFLPAPASMPQERLGDLVADGERRVERGHRLLEDHREPGAPQLAQPRRRQPEQILAFEPHLARDDAPGRRRHEAHDAERGDALAAARFADDAERAAALEAEVDAVHGSHLACVGVEDGGEAADLKQVSYDGQPLVRSRRGRGFPTAAPCSDRRP